MKTVRIGVLGAGHWAVENHIPVLRSIEGVEIAGICRLGQDELRHICDGFGIPFGTQYYREILALPALDGVVISSPHNLHFEQAAAALERGISVVCEKPMTLHSKDARSLEFMVGESGKHFLIPFGWNYTDFAYEAKTRLQNDEIGEVVHVHCHMASALQDLFSGEGAWFAVDRVIKPDMSTWSNPATGGGFGYGQLTHALGLLFYITEFSPAQVFAMTQLSPTGADLSAAISCRFDNGVTGVIGGAATMPPDSTYQVDIRIFGKRGMMMLDLERPRLEIRRHDGHHFHMSMTAKPGEYLCKEPLQTFVRLLRGENADNRSSASIGRRTVEVLDAAFRSAQSGRREEV
jgi:predicted dehydrogenase